MKARSRTPNAAPSRSLMKRILVGLATVAITLIAADATSSLVYRTNRAASVSVFPGGPTPPESAVVLLPGYGMSGELAARALRRQMPRDTVILGVSYADRGVDLNQISHAVNARLAGIPSPHIYFYGASMGGIVANHLATTYAAEHRNHQVTLILDTAPSSAKDVRRPQILLAASCGYPGGALSSALWSLLARTAPRIPLSGSTNRLAQEGRQYVQTVGTPALTSQACFLHRELPVTLDQANFRVFSAKAPDADKNDPLVDTRSATARWRGTFPRLSVITIGNRQGRWHIPLVERPSDAAAVLAKVANTTLRDVGHET